MQYYKREYIEYKRIKVLFFHLCVILVSIIISGNLSKASYNMFFESAAIRVFRYAIFHMRINFILKKRENKSKASEIFTLKKLMQD
ncbi:hypothetical protein BpHYR1_049810 [Brachionus plicatilis]|uniref:Uncharacterized protein n=1 Tax=Brachionus plicatilis TaxID=10195 RepID=A0A3M7RL80_BRAPC|nr:hypothetical protein BpHYR1_049810 [Brachionus plicatilis]